MEEQFWYLKNCPLFERLTPEQVKQIENASLAKKFAKGNMIYMPDDASESVFLLTSGRIKLYHVTQEGKQALLALIEPGEVFGELAVFDEDGREEFAEAMAASTLIKIPREEMQQLMEAHSGVALGVTKLMGFRRRRIERRLKSLLFRSNKDRLVHLLLELAEKYGRESDDGVFLTIKLSHQELASIIGSTRETVTVVLGELQQSNLITIQRRQILINKLKQLADSINSKVPQVEKESPFIRRQIRPAEYG